LDSLRRARSDAGAGAGSAEARPRAGVTRRLAGGRHAAASGRCSRVGALERLARRGAARAAWARWARGAEGVEREMRERGGGGRESGRERREKREENRQRREGVGGGGCLAEKPERARGAARRVGAWAPMWAGSVGFGFLPKLFINKILIFRLIIIIFLHYCLITSISFKMN
jgi:hypothetical protein